MYKVIQIFVFLIFVLNSACTLNTQITNLNGESELGKGTTDVDAEIQLLWPSSAKIVEGLSESFSIHLSSVPSKKMTAIISIKNDSAQLGVDLNFTVLNIDIEAGQGIIVLPISSLDRIGYQGSRAFIVNIKINAQEFEHSFKIIENSVPPSLATVSVYSSLVGNKHSSVSSIPDYKAAFSSLPSSPVNLEFELVKVSDSSQVASWSNTSDQVVSWTSKSGMSLTNGTSYIVRGRSVDLDSLQSSAWVNSSQFVIDVLTSTPYSGLGLPDVDTLTDITLSNAAIAGNTYTRLAPRQGKTLNLNGTIDWTTSQASSLFFRAKTINLAGDALLTASGRPYYSDNWGTQGGSGGAAPTGCGGVPGSGGSAGNNGGAASGGSCMGQVGLGFGQYYSVGFTYGNGGNGGIGNGTGGGGVAGIGSNGAGGGGGGTYNLWGGGTGGGGLIVALADEIKGTANVYATGGMQKQGHPDMAGAGGGGVIWIATKKYHGNLHPVVQAGKGNIGGATSGTAGTARIFQINSDNSLTERRFEDSWTESSFTPHDGIIPYPLSQLASVTTLADETLATSTIDGFTYSRVNPFSRKNLTIDGTITPTVYTPHALFIRAQNLVLNALGILRVSATGIHGGSGGSGSGGCGNTPVKRGGSAGADGDFGAGSCPRAGGWGWGQFYNSGFNYGSGGNGGTNSDLSLGGLGGNGAGGGGTGSSGGAYGSGGGGGGLVVVVVDSLSGSGSIEAKGADATGSYAGGGGGGVIWVAAKSYTGTISTSVAGGTGLAGGSAGAAGTARIFKINSDGTLTQKLFTDSW